MQRNPETLQNMRVVLRDHPEVCLLVRPKGRLKVRLEPWLEVRLKVRLRVRQKVCLGVCPKTDVELCPFFFFCFWWLPPSEFVASGGSHGAPSAPRNRLGVAKIRPLS